jgi:hypothetical protein
MNQKLKQQEHFLQQILGPKIANSQAMHKIKIIRPGQENNRFGHLGKMGLQSKVTKVANF